MSAYPFTPVDRCLPGLCVREGRGKREEGVQIQMIHNHKTAYKILDSAEKFIWDNEDGLLFKLLENKRVLCLPRKGSLIVDVQTV